MYKRRQVLKDSLSYEHFAEGQLSYPHFWMKFYRKDIAGGLSERFLLVRSYIFSATKRSFVTIKRPETWPAIVGVAIF